MSKDRPKPQPKKLVIAEKPSVADDIARALRCCKKRGDVYESETMVIAAAAGHLLETKLPKTWDLEALPILPERLELAPVEKQVERLSALVNLLSREDVVGVINACDAGREGELIFWEIMHHAGCTKAVDWLWLQSMTTAAIKRASRNCGPLSPCRGWRMPQFADRWLTFGSGSGLRPDSTAVRSCVSVPLEDNRAYERVYLRRGNLEAVTQMFRLPGWWAVDGKVTDAPPVGQAASDVAASATIASVVIEEWMTTPPRGHFTDGTLVKPMESAGKLVDDEEAQEEMRGSGLGTAATRTQTVNKLLSDGYLERKGRELHATPKAMSLRKLLEQLRLEVLMSPEMTGKWEARLSEIETNSAGSAAFTVDIRMLAEELTKRGVSAPADLVPQEFPDIRLPGTNQPFVELLHDFVTADRSVWTPKIIRDQPLLPAELYTLFTKGLVVNPSPFLYQCS